MDQKNGPDREEVAIASMRQLIRNASESTARRLQLDDPTFAPQQGSKESKAEILVLAPSQRLSNDEPSEAQAAFSELDMSDLGASAANSAHEPPLSQNRFAKMAESALKQQIDALGADMVETLVKTVAPEHIDKAFEDFGVQNVDDMVAKIAPQKILDIADQILPFKIEEIIREAAREEVARTRPSDTPSLDSLEPTVANLIRRELAGDLGRSVTQKVRALVQAEIIQHLDSK